MKTLAELIAAAERELAMRRAVYPGRVAAKKMSQAKADHEIACMEGILKTLKTEEERQEWYELMVGVAEAQQA
jgi:hypothetical protein